MMRQIPTITKNLLIVNVLAYIAYVILGYSGIDLNDILGLHFFLASDFHIYQLFTYMFMHGGLQHIFFNMFALWMFGCVVENVWGAKKFLFYYILSGIGAGLCQEVAQFVQYSLNGLAAYDYVNLGNGIRMTTEQFLNQWTTVGASGAIYAILLAFGMIFPEQRIFIFPLPVPIKAKWFVILYAGIELFSAISSSGDGVAHIAHLGGMLFGFILIRYWKRHPYSDMGNYGVARGQEFFDRLKKNWEQRSSNRNTRFNDNSQTQHESDWEYNSRKQREQAEIDRILDKIRNSGYDSLTAQEKNKLFENSQ